MNTIGSGPRPPSPSPSDERASQRGRADSPAQRAVASGSSSLPIGPRQRAALADSVERTLNHLRTPLPAPNNEVAVQDWGATAATLRLDLARITSAIAHEDPLPPEPANQATAKLAAGSRLLRLAAEAAGLDEAGRNDLAAVLLQAQHQARNTHQLGLNPAETPPMEFVAGQAGLKGQVETTYQPGRPVVVKKAMFTAFAGLKPESLGAVAHESIHEAQDLLRDRPMGSGRADAGQAGAALAPREARAGFFAVGIGLPPQQETLPPPDEHRLYGDHYLTQPHELQAFLEETQVAVQSADAAQPLHAEMQPLLQAVIAPLLKAARDLDRPGPRPSPATPAHELPLRRYESSKHAATFENIARIVDAVADLDGASQSSGAQPAHLSYWAVRVQHEMSKVVAQTQSQPKEAQQKVQMRHLRRTLESLVKQLPHLGVNRHAPALNMPSPSVLLMTKHDPLSTAARALELRTHGEVHQMIGSLHRALTGSGLMRQVATLHALPPENRDAQQRAVRTAITGVAAQWLGIQPSELPPLDIHLYDAPNRTLPHVEGMNLHAGQARKARFERDTWQVHLPAHLLDREHRDKLPGHLAKLGFDAAHAADVLRSGRISDTHDIGRVFTGVALRIAETERPTRLVREAAPFAAPALLRRALTAHPSQHTASQAGRTFHEGPRAELKLAAHEPDPEVARPAREGLALHSMLRWHDPTVALRRALGAMANEMAAEANPSRSVLPEA